MLRFKVIRSCFFMFLLLSCNISLFSVDGNALVFLLEEGVALSVPEDGVDDSIEDSSSSTVEEEPTTSVVSEDPSAASEIKTEEASEDLDAEKKSLSGKLVSSITEVEKGDVLDQIDSGLMAASSALLGSGQLARWGNITDQELDLLIKYRFWLQKKKEEAIFQAEQELLVEVIDTDVEVDKASAVEAVLDEGVSSSLEATVSAGSVTYWELPQEAIDQANLLMDSQFEGIGEFIDDLGFYFVVKDLILKRKVSMKKYHYAEIRFVLDVYQFSGESIAPTSLNIAVAGFQVSAQKAFDQALDAVKNQMLTELSAYQVVTGRLAVVEILDKDEVVINSGSSSSVYKGATFSVVKYHESLLGIREEVVVGQLIVYKVTESHCFCEVLYLLDDIFVGDKVIRDKRIGLSTSVEMSFMASVATQTDDLGASDFINGTEEESHFDQHEDFIGAFSEFIGMIGLRETVDYGSELIKPFFGFDIFLDGNKAGLYELTMGGVDMDYSAVELYYLGVIVGNSFKKYRSFSGLLRPYVGASMNWNLNRVTLSPQLALGMIFNKRLELEDGNEHTTMPIPGSGLNYFTVTAGVDIKVRLNPQFTFDVKLGYDYWLGKKIDLADAVVEQDPLRGDILADDFVKFFDQQFVKVGVGFTVGY